jgi:mRNA interferase MazF
MRGEIWMIDLGLAAKPRPAVILSVPFRENEKSVVTYVARTTQVRGGRFEVRHEAPHFLPGAFDAQNLGTVPVARLMRRLARLPPAEMARLEEAVRHWLGMAAAADGGGPVGYAR